MTDEYQPSHDLEFRHNSRVTFWRDVDYGNAGEQSAANLYRIIREEPHRVEVKTERRANGRHFLERWQAPNRGDWKPSGIQTTTADVWIVCVNAPAVALHIYLTAELRALAVAGAFGEVIQVDDATNPTAGHVVAFQQLDEAITNYRRNNGTNTVR